MRAKRQLWRAVTSPCTQLMHCAGLQVEKVSYPALASSPDHALAAKLFGSRGGGVLSFMVKGSMAQTKSFLGVTTTLLISFSGALRCVQRPLHCVNVRIIIKRQLAIICPHM